MKYIIEYNKCENTNLNHKLHIYDFGHVKGFLYNNEFVMYKIIKREDNLETVELYEETIPKITFSVEEYDCEYSNGIYKIDRFDILVTPSLKAEAQSFEPQQYLLPSQPLLAPLPPPQQQVPHQKKHAYKSRNNQGKNDAPSSRAHVRVQPVAPQKQFSLDYSSAVKPQWTSLDQLMRQPLALVGQVHHLQQKPLKQNLPPLTPKKSSSSPLRPHQALNGKHVQNSKHPN